MLKILGNICYLARQSLPLQGEWNLESKTEEDSNFFQLLKLRSEDDEELASWLGQKSSKYRSPEIQNELIEIMALQVLREIAKNIQDAVIYTVLADETADVSNNEQLVLCIHWVDDNINVHEEFIGFHSMPGTTVDEIVFVIKDMLLRMNLSLENARGQCCNGASSVSGVKKGVATQIKSINSKCLYLHCFGHALNLAIGDSIKSVQCLKDVFDMAYEICKLVKKVPTSQH